MPAGFFSCDRDVKIEASGGFFCLGCLIAKPADTRSPDDRYCQGCYAFLLQEADGRHVGSWKPLIPGKDAVVDDSLPLPIAQEVVSKMLPDGGVPPGIMKRGRPRKEGQVSRATQWRRNKGLAPKDAIK